ncbi:sensor histidine kinase [Cohnella abietis]|uniref:histidine kinase n=1 Tax=Cohnella abietis TaxID=2507935 RepID=A0A3T1CZF2_9BACL|nr:ATP-binding protein [Cohnella abietis]BBI31232.1 two-component sensor histidine kinase [Cohnella abietis]
MNHSWGTKRRLKDDVFHKTHKKLSWQYSGVLIVFLSLFVIIVYTLLYVFIWNDQHRRLNNLADHDLSNLQAWADQDNNPKRPPPRSVEDTFSISTDQSFYYLVAENGSIQLGDEIQAELREQVMALIINGQFRGKQIDMITLQTFSSPSAKMEKYQTTGENAKFIVTHRSLQVKGHKIATLYIGKEVTFQHDLFRWLLILLIGMALLFFVLATWFSHLMSRKAMVPIANAYARQREFVADASHELRTPLSVMLASIEALQLDESAENVDSFSRKVLNGLKAEVSSMTRLSGNLLRLARSDSDEGLGEQTLFDARSTATQVIDKLSAMAKAKDISMTLHAPTKLMVTGDIERLTQLLVLLIDNAIKYTPDNGFVQITIAEGVDRGVRFFTFEVKDSGIGIPADALPRIFDRFYRQDKSRTRQTGGHGLGLAIAKTIVDSSGGNIRVTSHLGEGSSFKVQLPWI